MRAPSKFKLSSLVVGVATLFSASVSLADTGTPGLISTDAPGKWTKGDLHTHTVESDDSRTTQTLDFLLKKSFDYKLDWLALTNHLRASSYDNNGNKLPSSVAFAYPMESYEIQHVKALQSAGTYADKKIFSGFEWDVPTHDHVGVTLFDNATTLDTATRGVREFQYRFTTLAEDQFDSQDVAVWKSRGVTRTNSTAADALTALSWLKTNYPTTSFATLNHPSRNPGKYTVNDLRQMNDLAPDILFMIEGMVGNQMEPDRGGYTSDYTSANLPNRVYGGVDAMVAKVGGMWDALLGEGRHIWNIADSDSHFKIDSSSNSSGYYPGEYSKNYLWMPDTATGSAGMIDSLRAGRLFGVFGDLIDALDFRVVGSSGTAYMGQTIDVGSGERVKFTIKFKSPETNNYLKPVDGDQLAYMKPVVNHVDLIVGDVTAKAAAGTPAYSVATNASTHVLKRFTAADWKVGADGYASITVQLQVNKNQYFRLRGTNLAVDTPGLSSGGEPLADQKATGDNTTRLNAINDRNYSSLWFYSNPVFVTVH
ncbi:S-layer protein [Paucibacter sp. R3-3]|uniref:S-layer protein n=1 Tax=Roseateles agri TaxID=3098619 RepID=A0ABU5DBK7_9BURK|nr:S-layer protein [Paucibacter sp. R3-3]